MKTADSLGVGAGLGLIRIVVNIIDMDLDRSRQVIPDDDHEAAKARTHQEQHLLLDSHLLINRLTLLHMSTTLPILHILTLKPSPTIHSMDLTVPTFLPHLHLHTLALGLLPHPHICRACPSPHKELVFTIQLFLLLLLDTILLPCLYHQNNLFLLDNITFLLPTLVANMEGHGVLQADKVGDEYLCTIKCDI